MENLTDSSVNTNTDCYSSEIRTKRSENELHSDFISLLSAFQKNNVDIVPTTWQPGFGLLGQGTQGTINQSDVSLQHSFGFKRVRESEGEHTNFGSQITEINILYADGIRDHPHIINIEAVCWEVFANPDRVL